MTNKTLPRLRVLVVLLIPLALLLGGGCGDDRAVRIAREAADRQAEQNKEIARQNQQIAETARGLVEADGQARKELTALQHDLQAQEAEVAKQRDALEAERRQIAGQRLRDSLLAPALESCAVALACALVLALCVHLARGLQSQAEADQAMGELLIQELVSPRPILLPPFPAQVGTVRQLPAPGITETEKERACLISNEISNELPNDNA